MAEKPSTTQWTRLGSAHDTLLTALISLYWQGVEHELRIIIIALAEFMQCFPEEIDVERIPPKPNRERMDYFMGEWGMVEFTPEEKTRTRGAFKAAARSFHEKPLVERRAKQLLQAAGWLDIDFIHNDRPPPYPSMTGSPKVADVEQNAVFQAVQCSICRKCIRTQFFECMEGCKDVNSTKNYYKCVPPNTSPSDENSTISHLIPRMALTPFRACFSCIALPLSELSQFPHDRTHLGMVNMSGYYDQQVPEKLAFIRELNALEDFQSGNGRMGTVAMGLMRVTGGKVRKLVPAGNVHMAFRFGTLMVENGVPGTQSGVLITTRSPQSLLLNPPPASMLPLEAQPSTKLALSPDRSVFVSTGPFPPRRILAVVKQVVTNPFNSVLPHHAPCETLPGILASAANAYRTFSPLLPLSAKRSALHEAAEKMVAVLQECLADDVRQQLLSLVKTLTDKETKLTWHPIWNNCQKFCNLLLQQRYFASTYWDPAAIVTKRNSKHENDNSEAATTTCGKGTLFQPFRMYTHSFAGATIFPLLPPSSSPPSSSTNQRLQTSDIGAYLSSLHNSSDLISFSIGRKLWRAGGLASANLDHIVGVDCGMGCFHLSSDDPEVQKRDDPMIMLSDHVLQDPFNAMAILASHLERPRGLYTEEKTGRLWSEDGSVPRRLWTESRLRTVVGVDVFLTFVFVVDIMGRVAEKEGSEGSKRRERKLSRSVAEGRSVMMGLKPRDWEEKKAKEGKGEKGGDNHNIRYWEAPGRNMWEMQPEKLPAGSLRKRFRCSRMWRKERKMMSDSHDGEPVTWRKCPCEYCRLTNEELQKARMGG